MVAAEEAQERGREGVMNVKRWLEATMRFDVHYTVYDQPDRVALSLLDGRLKRYDAVAQHFLDDRPRTPSGRNVYVEVKSLSSLASARKQSTQFPEFVATAYSAMAVGWHLLNRDPGWDFMFATTHPWDIENYLTLATRDYVIGACQKHQDLLADEQVDADKATALSDHLWVWIIPRRQDEMTMGPTHLGHVWQALKAGT